MLGGIEAGGTKCIVAVSDADLKVIETARIPTTTPDETFHHICQFFAEISRRLSAPLRAIGVASFGPVNIDANSAGYGTILNTPKPGWASVSYLQRLSSLDVLVVVDTDVNAAALAEQGDEAGTLAYITVGTGIGVGVVQSGTPLSGFSHYEMGHIIPRRSREDTFDGVCPSHGDCLEGLASGPAIKARWGAALSDLPSDHAAHDMEADYLAQLVHSITLMHAPHRIILGGGVMNTLGLIERVRQRTETSLKRYMVGAPLDEGLNQYITKPRLGDASGITGALALARQAV